MFKLIVLTGLIMGVLICMTSAQRSPRPFGGPNGRPFGRPFGRPGANHSRFGGNGTHPHRPFLWPFGRNHSAGNGVFGPPGPFKPSRVTGNLTDVHGGSSELIDDLYHNGTFHPFMSTGRRSGGSGSNGNTEKNNDWILPFILSHTGGNRPGATGTNGRDGTGNGDTAAATGPNYGDMAMWAKLLASRNTQTAHHGSD